MKLTLILISIIALSLIVPFSVGAHGDHGAKKGVFTKHFNESLFKVTEKGLFSIEILPDEREYKIGKDVIGLVIHDENDRDVEDAVITITLEGITHKPFVIREKGDGLYTVSNLDLKQEGSWKLIINVKKGKKQDRAIFIFPDILLEKVPAGKYEFKQAHQPHRHEEYARIKNPILMNESSVARGGDLFNKHCITCHGESERGSVASDLTDNLWIHGHTDGEIFHVISEGI